MKTAEEYINTMMWNGGNTTEEKINWILADYKQSIIGLIDELRANITILCISGGGKKN